MDPSDLEWDWTSDEDSPGVDGGGGATTDEVVDPEVWQDYHSEELVTLWHQLVDTISSMGVYVLDRCSFSDFAQFCFERSSGRKPPC